MVFTDKGFVIKKNDLLNDDKVVQLFLQDHGKISAVAKGAKKFTSRKAGNLELLQFCKFGIATGKNLDIITEIVSIDPFLHIREQESLIYFLFYVDEVIYKMVYDGEINLDLFDLLNEVLPYIDEHPGSDRKKVASYLNAKALVFSGVFPELFVCVKCGRKIEEDEEKVFLLSGLAHKSCTSGKEISNAAIKALRYLMEGTLEKYLMINMEESVEDTILSLTIDLIEYTIGSSIRSKSYLYGKSSDK
jgi:DNA repair protein RecO (recombination protein O)